MAIRLFCSDLDGTLIGKPDSGLDFTETWKTLSEASRPLLVYNSGRLVEDAKRKIREARLPDPDYLIAGVGTLIYDFRKGVLLRGFSQILGESWNRERAELIVREQLPDARLQPERFQTEFKCSWFAEDVSREDIEDLRARFDGEPDIDTHVIYSSSRDLDILPRLANKGNALDWLLRTLGIPRDEALVAGDTGNDSTMFQLKGVHGIIVENAEPELLEAALGMSVFQAATICAEGVLEGLLHYGVIDGIVRSRGRDIQLQPHDPEIKKLLEDGVRLEEDAEHREFLGLAYDKAIDGLRRCMTPHGFAACSVEDNEIRGTDENYRAVWGRDGAITVIGSLGLGDDDIRACQRATLATLLTHISPTGQIPANVQIDTQKPDYSGVGGIASIDSGLWLIIAAHEYVSRTKDIAFLREYRTPLQRAMDWLSAHDSNNDGLLEIPEAGDWMDLFNRSYNVLVDEVIWYRANVSFGRILELLGDLERASHYIVWSESIKQAILRRFWPSTSATRPLDKRSFTEIQSSLGDSSYLLAQVAPFSFDWRCDIYGNILAVLFNVLDIERAKVAFRFMWGVGVNDPFPVKNLYPVVSAGDPDWRSYYTVNLLNLPNHYHNGGIWPFIGGQWVRFIDRLGLHEIAFSELVRLAELNRQGVHQEWEFNEWMHGLTGRPMGKRFQAWSCSEFIRAYQDIVLSP